MLSGPDFETTGGGSIVGYCLSNYLLRGVLCVLSGPDFETAGGGSVVGYCFSNYLLQGHANMTWVLFHA